MNGLKFGWLAGLVIIGVSLSGCQTAPQDSPGSPFDLSEVQRARIRAGVTTVLKDPDSARFGAIKATLGKDGVISVCGTVNARNSFGGYTGPQPFIGVMTSLIHFRVASVGGTRDKSEAIAKICANRGIRL